VCGQVLPTTLIGRTQKRRQQPSRKKNLFKVSKITLEQSPFAFAQADFKKVFAGWEERAIHVFLNLAFIVNSVIFLLATRADNV